MQDINVDGVEVQDSSIIITLDELTSNEIPDAIWELKGISEMRIQKTRYHGWVTYPPISWYETREFTPPYWKLPNEIRKLQNLKSLYLVDLDIATLPDAITQLQALEMLNLSLNKLQLSNELSKLGKLTSLKDLKITGNHYNELEMEGFKADFPEMVIEYRYEE